MPSVNIARTSNATFSPPSPPVASFSQVSIQPHSLASSKNGPAQVAPPPGRKLCVRHQRMADEDTNLKLQQVSVV